ncbi:diguanylate cyclase [Mitsuaria sp. WAJ17]|uniref:sensor domain-containing diguanylate cyclase n=1 Tax=Mitsuaria sp. WAJ17 TaxID=2761452 RepID=UPI00160416EB|nr:sensor domain-containing diguanylate cyclase [Mitsuaria sp. WAJ17]MBB2487314.1 diguanylate cyclase [Mitsuaria sp. WAJ17]
MWLFFAWRSLRLRMALTFGLLAVIVALSMQSYIGIVFARHVMKERTGSLQNSARTVAAQLSEQLRQRQRELDFIATLPVTLAAPSDARPLRALLSQLKGSFRDYAWIGFADPQGRVLVSSDGVLEGVDVSQRPWFQGARVSPFIGDLHDALLLAHHLSHLDSSEPPRMLDFAVPLRDARGRHLGVVGSHVHWRWFSHLLQDMEASGVLPQGMEVMIARRDGQLIYPEAEFDASAHELLQRLEREPVADDYIRDEHYFLVAAPVPAAEHGQDVGWTVLVRQPTSQLLATSQQLAQGLWLLWGGGALAIMLMAYLVAVGLSRPVEQLATLLRGRQAVPAPNREDLSTTREMDDLLEALHWRDKRLAHQREELERNAQELEARVEQRTTELRQANAELERVALTDALTGLHNRGHLNARLTEEFTRYVRHRQPYGVLLMDIDHFKLINDAHGHATGDAVLMEFAALIKSSLRASDFVGRFGGEEFLALLPGTTLEGAAALAAKLCQKTREQTFKGVGYVTVSIGVAEIHEGDALYEDVVRRADTALYEAKNAGRNRFMVAPSGGTSQGATAAPTKRQA